MIREGYQQTAIGLIPCDWDVKKLGEVGKITMGQSPSSKFYNLQGYGMPLIQGNADVKDRETIIRMFTSSITKRCNQGDIILSVRAPVGSVSKATFDGCIGRGVCAISYPNEYLYQYLIYFEPNWSKLSKGSTFDSVNSTDLQTLEIPLPPLPEQKAIAEVLGDVDRLINACDKLIVKKRDIKQGAMQELLTGRSRLPSFSGEWEVKKLGEVLQYEQPVKYLVKNEEYNDHNDVPVLTANKSFILGYTNEKEGIYKNIPVIIFDDFTTLSKYVNFKFKVKSSAIKLLTVKNNLVDLKFIYEMIQILSFSVGDHKRYYLSEYQYLKITIPSLEEQKAIANILSDMDREIEALEKKRDKYKLIKQGMMQELLTGSIRI